MSPERWKNLTADIKDKFEVEETNNFHLEEEGGLDIEEIIFKGPLGRMKLEFITKPVVLDKKTTYSRRIGSETKVDYIYSPLEKSHKLKVYKWDEAADDWLEMDNKNFNL